MKNIYKITLIFVAFYALLSSCETTELDLLQDPNVPTPDNLDPDTNLNFVLFSFAEFFEDATEAGGEAVRLEYMFDTYQVNYNNTNVNLSGMWTTAYADIFNEIQAIEPILQSTNRFGHLGILKTIRAFTLMTLVDYFGDIPYTEALQGTVFPNLDDDLAVYEIALNDLNDAIQDFGAESGFDIPNNELFYGGDTSKWLKLINTLKLKYYLNLRLVNPTLAETQITSLLGEDLITDSADDFRWNAGTADNPQSKHQYYVEEYEAANPGEYIPNYLAWALALEKGIEDPRLRYYIYRQVDAFPTDPATLDNEIDCWNDPRPTTYGPIDAISSIPLPFCALFGRGDGYWGRDHADADGIPPDGAKRMTFGVYPAGGRFDANDADSIDAGDGLDGAGLWPIMMNSFVYFMRAEAALYLNTADDSKEMLEMGIRASISTVMNLGGSYVDGIAAEIVTPDDPDTTEDETVTKGDLYVPTTMDIDEYVMTVMNAYDGAASNDQKMAIIGKEYWLALYGNGVEGYNLYRRTGAPANLQPTLLGTGTFPRSFLYPNVSVDRNPNINQKSGLAEKVFWDNNPDNFIQ